MCHEKVAIFVDWDNLRFLLDKIRRNHRTIDTFNYNNPSHLTQLFRAFVEPNERIYRIFFYTAKPLTDEAIEKQLKSKDKKAFRNYVNNRPHSIYDIATSFLQKLIQEPYIALRCGVLKVKGVKQNGVPDIVQKQVDMLMGLDISEVTFNKHAQKILVFSKDTDMKPALKMARINGLEVVMANFEEMNYLAYELISHSDIIRTRALQQINDDIKT